MGEIGKKTVNNETNINYEFGDFIITTSGKSYFISKRDNDDSVSLETAKKWHDTGLIVKKTVLEDGDEVFIDVIQGDEK